jgi:hypothetical protein
LIVSAIAFLLPWVEVRCDGPAASKRLASQSGLQAIYGGITPLMQPPKELQPKKPNRTPREVLNDLAKSEDLLAECSPAMLLYALLLIVAIMLGFRLRQLRMRRAFIGGLAGLALLLLLLQTAVGFPLERGVKNAQEQQRQQQEKMRQERQERRRQSNGVDDRLADLDARMMEAQLDAMDNMAAAIVIDIRYTGCYWLALVCHLAALLALAFLESPQTENRIKRFMLAWQEKGNP